MDDEKLIEAVRKYRVLFDISSVAYRNADKKNAAWRLISEELACQGTVKIVYNVDFTGQL